jgi:hypothetical protein
MKKLSVWKSEMDSIVAYSAEDALTVWCDFFGEDFIAFEGRIGYVFSEVPDDQEITIMDLDTEGRTTMKACEWVGLNGRGILCTSEF